jgi:hypothetical protein
MAEYILENKSSLLGVLGCSWRLIIKVKINSIRMTSVCEEVVLYLSEVGIMGLLKCPRSVVPALGDHDFKQTRALPGHLTAIIYRFLMCVYVCS